MGQTRPWVIHTLRHASIHTEKVHSRLRWRDKDITCHACQLVPLPNKTEVLVWAAQKRRASQTKKKRPLPIMVGWRRHPLHSTVNCSNTDCPNKHTHPPPSPPPTQSVNTPITWQQHGVWGKLQLHYHSSYYVNPHIRGMAALPPVITGSGVGGLHRVHKVEGGGHVMKIHASGGKGKEKNERVCTHSPSQSLKMAGTVWGKEI